jgi:hypothetical protein
VILMNLSWTRLLEAPVSRENFRQNSDSVNLHMAFTAVLQFT